MSSSSHTIDGDTDCLVHRTLFSFFSYFPAYLCTSGLVHFSGTTRIRRHSVTVSYIIHSTAISQHVLDFEDFYNNNNNDDNNDSRDRSTSKILKNVGGGWQVAGKCLICYLCFAPVAKTVAIGSSVCVCVCAWAHMCVCVFVLEWVGEGVYI